MSEKTSFVLSALSCLLTIPSAALAGEPVVWEMSSRTELLKGEAVGSQSLMPGP